MPLTYLRSSPQRIAFLSLCVSVAVLTLQLVIYSYYVEEGYFWNGLVQCLSIRVGYGCNSPYHVISHNLMYLNIAWVIASAIYIFYEQNILAISTWITGQELEPPNQLVSSGPIDEIHPYQSVHGRSLDELASIVGNVAVHESTRQAARAAIARLEAKAIIETAAYNRHIATCMLLTVILTAIVAILTIH